jgi:hypothetical protein
MLLRGMIRLSLSERSGASRFAVLGFKLMSAIKAIKPSNVIPDRIGEIIFNPPLPSQHSVQVVAIRRRRLPEYEQEH